MQEIMIEKLDGTMEPLNPDKYHKHLEDACEGYPSISMSEIEMNASVHIVNGTKSADIQDAFIRIMAETIYNNADADVPAGRLLNQSLRKQVYGKHEPLPLIDMVIKNTENGVYDGDYLFEHYTIDDIKEVSKFIDYSKDDSFTYGGLKKDMDSYLIRQYNEIMETPQEMHILIQMFLFAKYKNKYDEETRMFWIKEGYRIMSEHEVSFPTPIMKQLRSSFRRFISCVLIPYGDNKQTIANAFRATLLLVAGGAGIGETVCDLRGLGADIDNGRLTHTGVFPIVKASEKTTKAFTQPDRDGSASNYYSFFHMEINSFMVFGNAKGTDDTRVRDMDHAIMFNDYFFERYAKDEEITLFYMNDVVDINSYLGDYDEFKRRYEYAEATIPEERTTKVSARTLFHTFINERFLQSREYTAFMDNVMKQGPWKLPIKQLNLCAEIGVPNYPMYSTGNFKRNIIFISEEHKERFYKLRNELYHIQIDDRVHDDYLSRMEECYVFAYNDVTAEVNENLDYDYFDERGYVNLGEIGVCIIGGINMGMVSDDRIAIVSEYMVRAEDELIDYMEYDMPEIEKAAKMRRTIGIGFSDVAHDMARHKKFYNTKEGRQFFHDRVERFAYHMTETSIKLAEEFGPCKLYRDTKYADGILPVDTYAKTVDELVDHNAQGLDWDSLKARAKKSGIRHSTLMANAPFSGSATRSNSTPGIEFPRSLIAKKSGLPKVVPEYNKFKDYYVTTWSPEFNNIDYFKFTAVAQKFIDQLISLNQYHDLTKFPDNKVPKSLLVEEVLAAQYYGNKSLYYLNIKSKNKNDSEENKALKDVSLSDLLEDDDAGISSCEGGGCQV